MAFTEEQMNLVKERNYRFSIDVTFEEKFVSDLIVDILEDKELISDPDFDLETELSNRLYDEMEEVASNTASIYFDDILISEVPCSIEEM